MAKESGRLESRESVERRMEKFIPTAVRSFFIEEKAKKGEKKCYRIVLEVMIGGVKRAVSFMANRPAELFFGDDRSGDSTAPLKGLRDFANSRAGQVLQAVTGVGCAAMAGACAPSADIDHGSNDDSPGMSGQFGTTKARLTGTDAYHFGTPWPAPISEWGDNDVEITEYEGKSVIVIARNIGEGGFVYVECDKLEDCLKFGVTQEIKGLPESYIKWWNSEHPDNPLPPDYIQGFSEGTIFEDENGQYKFIAGTLDETLIGDISNNDGVLTVSNLELPPVEIGSFSGPVPINGAPHLFHGSYPQMLLNLHTWEEQETGFSSDCSDFPHWSKEGSWIVAQDGKYEQGKLVCEFESAESLPALINKIGIKKLSSINKYNATALGAWGGRIAQKVFIYVAAGPKGTKIYCAVIEPYCGDGKADEGETFENCPQDVPQSSVDTVTNPPDADAGSTGQETGGPDVVVGTDTVQIGDMLVDTASLDAALAETMKEVDGAVGVDAQGADTQPDTQTDTVLPPDTKPDTQSNPDTLVSCDDVEFEGNCNMSCDEPNATFTGKCTATVNIGGKFAKFEIDGEYTFNLLEKVGTLLEGSVEVDDKGVGVSTSYGDYESTPTGTVYGGEGVAEGNFDVYKVWVKEGQMTVYYNGEEIAVLNVGDEVTFANGEPITPVQPEEGEDASQADSGQTDASEGTDADKPDLGGGKDAGSSVDTSNNPGEDTEAQVEPKKGGGGGGGGCSTSPAGTSKTTESGSAIPLGAVGLALLALVRKLRTPKEKAVEVESPRS